MNSFCHLNPTLHQQLKTAIDREADPAWRADLHRAVPPLIDLMAEAHEKPMQQYKDTIRSILVEHWQFRPCDHPAGRNALTLERELRWLIERLESLRREEVACGDWSDAPVPPQMFG